MEDEFIALEQNQICEIVPRLEDVKPIFCKPIFCKWIYKIKHPQDELTERYKTQLVV